MQKRIPIAGPWVTEKEVRYVADAAANDWYENAGSAMKRFETAFAEYIGTQYAVAVPHCTAALHLSLASLRIGPGDEVIVPESTWVATAAPICYMGATPVFADIDERSWCISPASLKARITPRTKAIMVVDLYGGVPDMDAIDAIANEHGLPVIEDAAQAIGAEYRGRRAGSLGKAATFSFHGTKTLTTGEGGMLVTNDKDIYDRSIFLRDHGRPPGSHRTFYTTEVGFKYRMSGLQAAFGLAQLERIDEIVAKKREIFAWYEERLSKLEGITLNTEMPNTRNTYWMVTVVADKELGLTTQKLIEGFDVYDMDARPYFHPLSSLPAFAPYAHPDARALNPVAHDIAGRSVNLPSALMITREQVDQVCSALEKIVDKARSNGS